MSLLAPIIVFCYNRLDHLERTIDALKQNSLSKSSDIYIFADGAKSALEKAEVQKVHDYISKIAGFKSVNIHISQTNKGLANSVISGVTEVISKHGKVIVLEDDIRISNDFLSFMNSALDKYEQHENIFSVSGYSYKMEDTNFENSVFLLKRCSSWGWGTWKSRWETVDWNVNNFQEFLNDKIKVNKFQDGGIDLLPMLVKQQRGVIDSWAIRWTYHHFKNDAFCLIPKLSKVQNIGTDGSGTNFKNIVSRYDTELHDNHIVLPDALEENPKVTSFIRNYYKPSLIRRIINYYRYGIW